MTQGLHLICIVYVVKVLWFCVEFSPYFYNATMRWRLFNFFFNMTQTSFNCFNCLKCKRLVFSLSNRFLFSISFYHTAVLTQESKYVLERIFDIDNLLKAHMQSNTSGSRNSNANCNYENLLSMTFRCVEKYKFVQGQYFYVAFQMVQT